MFYAPFFLLPLCIAQTTPEPLAGFELDGESWTYKDGDLSLRGILLKPAGTGPFPAVLISHGLGGNAQTFGRTKAREMVKWGLVCMACDYTHAGATNGSDRRPEATDRRTFGASEENLRRASKCLDILASLPEVDAKKLCAYGHSMGGFVTIGLAAKEPGRLVAAAISGSGIAPREGFAAPSSDAASRIKTPIIMFHGSIDNTVRPAQSLALKEILEKNGVLCERHVFEGINHPVDREKAQEVLGLTRSWLARFKLIDPEPKAAGAGEPVKTLAAASEAPRGKKGRPAAAAGPPAWVREKIEARNTHYRTFRSKTIGEEVSYVIYLPAAYDQSSEARFPVLYWLHGIGGAQTGIPPLVQRFDSAMERGQIPPLLIVFVNGMRDSFYCDSADGNTPVETVIVKDLIPHIDATYRTVAKREGRIIEGFSMGGFGAAHLGFKYPELFCAVSIIDGALLDLNNMRSRHPDLYQRVFGGSEERFAAEHPGTLVKKNADAVRGRTAIRLTVGALAAGNQALHEQLTELKLDHDYDTFDVGHNHAAIYESLGEQNWKFYQRALSQAAR